MKKKKFEYYCDDIENVENYEKAKADNFIGWNCHHRLETHNSDGERRIIDISHKELIALGMYWHRPSSELIFLTVKEHLYLHNKGKCFSEETRRKMSKSWDYKKHITEEWKNKKSVMYKGENNPFYGKHHTKELRKKLSEIASERNKGKHWYNDGEVNKFCYECPEGFIPGMLK